MGDLTRRKFLQGATAVAATSAFAALTGCESSADATSKDFLPETWDGEGDIVIVGAGGGALAAGIISLQNNLETIVLEAAPEQYMGGNSRVCGQFMFLCEDLEDFIDYQRALNDRYEIEEEYLRAWAENLHENPEWFASLGLDYGTMPTTAEFPEKVGSGNALYLLHNEGMGFSRTWMALKGVFDELGGEVTCDSRVKKLIFDPETKEVFGVTTEDGRNFKARKGVLLACGGFENNIDMKREYLDPAVAEMAIAGSPYNRGDGIEMANQIGARLWHMSNNAGPNYTSIYGTGEKYDPEFANTVFGAMPSNLATYAREYHDFIMIDGDGKRYMNEDLRYEQRHGKVYRWGTWQTGRSANPAWVIAGATIGAASEESGQSIAGSNPMGAWVNIIGGAPEDPSNKGYIDAGILNICETAEDIAAVTGVDAASIQATLDRYNGFCNNQEDKDLKRGAGYSLVLDGVETSFAAPHELVSIEPPYYVFPFAGLMANTQGGAKRNAHCQIVDHDDVPIPRLYGAGEFGTIYGFLYNGGCNLGDTVGSGRRAAREISNLESWEGIE